MITAELPRASAEDEDDFYLMANLSPKRTGLPYVVWISPRGNAQHDVRVQISRGPKVRPGEFVSVALRPTLRVVEGELTADEMRLLQAWVAINFDVIVQFWDGVIEYTENALAALLPLRAEA